MSRVAIVAALPGELKKLVKPGWTELPTQHRTSRKWSLTLDGNEWIAVCAGMGANAATRAFAEAEAGGRLDAVLSVGWAGALQEGMHPGEFFIPAVVVDAQTGERFSLTDAERKSVLVTTAHVADEREKRRLAESYGGALVDMESATIVRLAQMRGIPVCCMKVVTDEAGAKLPNLNPFINAMGQMEMWRFLSHVLFRPRYWMALMRLGRASSRAADDLACAIYNFMFNEARDIHEINRTGDFQDW